jgi:hypothetical protein
LGLHGRRDERETLDRLLDGVRAGQSRVLVLRGEAGVGKSALLEYLMVRASGCRIARAAGVESEMELAFAGLHQLCAPMLDRLDRLPAPQAEAIRIAFGLTAGKPPDRFFVGLAVLSLLSEVAEDEPLVCLIDDAQWLDRVSEQTLSFVARRLLAERVALVFAARESSERSGLAGLPEQVVGGLDESDARALLGSAIQGPVDALVLDRIVAETRGNPLALLELTRGMTPAEMAGGFGLPALVPLSTRIEQSFLRHVVSLPRDTRRLLLVAAAESLGDVTMLWRAAEHLGIGPDALAPAEAAGLIEVRARVQFRHPLVRSAAYRAGTWTERHEAHRALAEATDPEGDPDRRAWHRAHATAGLDEAVAGELERSANRAAARGGAAAAAAFLKRAAELTPDPKRRGARALAAASIQFEAGAPDTSYELLATAELASLDELERAQAERLRAKIAFARRHGSDAPPLLLKAATRLEPHDAELARDTYLEALSAALYVGRMDGPAGVVEVAAAGRAALDAARIRRAPDLLLDGLAVLVTEGHPAGAPVLLHALSMIREANGGEEVLRWLWLAIRLSGAVWDDVSFDVLTARHLEHAREAGALTELPLALAHRASLFIHAGELDAASALIEEGSALALAAGSAPLTYASLQLAAYQGREQLVAELIGSALADRAAEDDTTPLAAAEWMRAVLYNGLGRYEDAFVAGERATLLAHEIVPSVQALPELIEAATRSANGDRASEALERLVETTGSSGGDWALGVEARSRALLSHGEHAESL